MSRDSEDKFLLLLLFVGLILVSLVETKVSTIFSFPTLIDGGKS